MKIMCPICKDKQMYRDHYHSLWLIDDKIQVTLYMECRNCGHADTFTAIYKLESLKEKK